MKRRREEELRNWKRESRGRDKEEEMGEEVERWVRYPRRMGGARIARHGRRQLTVSIRVSDLVAGS